MSYMASEHARRDNDLSETARRLASIESAGCDKIEFTKPEKNLSFASVKREIEDGFFDMLYEDAQRIREDRREQARNRVFRMLIDIF